MATKIIMPKLGMAMKEGVVTRWLKGDGETVAKEEPIAVIMSKKITYTVTSPAAGILRVLTRAKETRPVGATLAYILAPGETIPAVEEETPETPIPSVAATAASAPPQSSSQASGFVLASPAARRLARERGVDLASVPGSGPEGMVTEGDLQRFLEQRDRGAAAAPPLATSAARRLAEERGVRLEELSGTGPGGRVTEEDVLAFLGSREEKAPPRPAPPPSRTIPFTGVRRAVAEHMVESLRTMAQLTLQMEVDATELVKLREQLKSDLDITYTDLMVKAVATALRRHPLLNASLVGEEILLLDSIDIGIAVALDDGLIVPVVRNADTLSVAQIAQEARRLARGAREGTLSVDEVTGSSFTITNLGAYGIDGFTPIINSPEVAILGLGRIAEKPVVSGGEIVRRSMMVLSLTIDHRVVDGAPAAQFLGTLRGLIESPYRLLM